MNRLELEHVIRAAGSIADCSKLVVIGSQAILGSFAHPPPELTVSHEADIYPLDCPENADLIDGSIGEKSPFHQTFGYYAHGVAPETAVLPTGWQTRLVPISNENTHGITGLCLDPADLGVSKLVAGREKDLAFVTSLLLHELVDAAAIKLAISGLSTDHIPAALERLEHCRRAARSV